MGTKSKPGRFDCYANALPDEPMFVLLGRDSMGASLVQLWALAREGVGENMAVVEEAQQCADDMEQHCSDLGKRPVSILDLLPFDLLADALRRRGARIDLPNLKDDDHHG